MNVPYDRFTEAFLSKVTEYNFIKMDSFSRVSTIDGYMKRAIAAFRHICKFDFTMTADDNIREFLFKVKEDDDEGTVQAKLDAQLTEDLDDIVDIISEGMLVQWMKPYTYNQENLEIALNTKDYSGYSPAGMLNRISSQHDKVSKNFKSMMREYSYTHGDLTDLHI